MRKIIVIGTIHGGFTPEEDLRAIFQIYKPDQLFVEISEEDLRKERLEKYPVEMIYAYRYAKEHGMQVHGFDFFIERHDLGQKNLKVTNTQLSLIKQYTWKDFNKEQNLQLLYPSSYWKRIDKEEKIRREEMLHNIHALIQREGTILILTGAGHLKFFEKHLKDAQFPFRK